MKRSDDEKIVKMFIVYLIVGLVFSSGKRVVMRDE